MSSVGGLLFYEESTQWEVDLVKRGKGRELGEVKGKLGRMYCMRGESIFNLKSIK